MRPPWPKIRRLAADADDLIPPTAPTDTATQDTRLLAAREGWGTTLRYGLLRLVDRAYLIGISFGLGGAAAPGVSQLLMKFLDAKG
jgi:hypothetical protein